MTRIALIYGSLAGLIMGSMFFIMHPANGEMDFENSEFGGYLTMTAALVAIFFGVKQYRDKELKGPIGFGKAFGVGVLITLVASIFYVASWEVYSATIGGGFADQYVAYTIEQLNTQEKDQVVIEQEIADTKAMMELYKENTFYRIGMSFIEVFPIGVFISALTAVAFVFLLKRKPSHP